MKTGLILVDIQNDYFPGGRMELKGMEEAAARAKDLLSFFRENHQPTFHVQHISIRENASFFLPDTAGVEMHESIIPVADEPLIQKHYPNSFRETDLLQKLNKDQIERVVICGAMSHMCIDATARAAFDFGFDCLIIQDACATRDLEFEGKVIAAEQVHGSFMAALGSAYAQILNSNEFEQWINNP